MSVSPALTKPTFDMLNYLTIKNVALIRATEIEFYKGLNVLSGETGAGKSVVLEALNFALGQKANKSMICRGETECSVTCSFDVSCNEAVKRALSECGFDDDDELIVKRTLSDTGKSTIRLNGEPITSSSLRKITSLLVDVHGQSDHFMLLKEANQLSMIDGLGQNDIEPIKDDIRSLLSEIKAVDDKLALLGGNDVDKERKIDYLRYAIGEIESADVSENEENELQERKKKLGNLEKITNTCAECHDALSSEGGVTDVLSNVSRKISTLSQYGKDYEKLLDRLEGCLDEISDISEIIGESRDEEFDAEEIETIERRLEVIRSIKKKYGKTYDEVVSTLNSFKEELNLIVSGAEETAKLNDKRAVLVEQIERDYDRLSVIRKKVAESLEKALSEKLKELAMKNVVFKVEFNRLQNEVLSENGRDRVTFMFNANKGEALNPLSEVISGGELSRLMLAIKSVTGGNFGAETFIFDEIDSGISGEAAEVVAENFAKISQNRQIIAISHLPQIVAMADVGFLIYKKEESERTVTHVERLDENGKVSEVVRLVGGNLSSNTAVLHAKELVSRADEYKKSINEI